MTHQDGELSLRGAPAQAVLGSAGLIVAVLTAAWCVRLAVAQAGAQAEFSTPIDGDVLRGEIQIRGTANSEAFLSAELTFAYADDQTDTWFLIAEVPQSVVDADLASWDTAAVADGPYRLRLRLSMLDGTRLDDFASVQVRNYTAPILATAAAAATTVAPPLQVETPALIAPAPTESQPAQWTPTSLPPNSAAVTPASVFSGLIRGGLAVVAIALIVLVLLLRRQA